MTNYNRISSIDIMRGLTLVLMLFVNDLNMNVAPAWLGHRPADFDGMGLRTTGYSPDSFLRGNGYPFCHFQRDSHRVNLSTYQQAYCHRSLSLIIIGVLMLNTGRVNPELTGDKQNLWAILMYLGVFLSGKIIPIRKINSLQYSTQIYRNSHFCFPDL